MKRILSIITVFTLLFTACEGDPGPPGFDGLDADEFAARGFEIVLDFNAEDNFEWIEPYGFQLPLTASTLVYISWEVDNGEDIWRLVPQTVIFEDGNDLVYNYDFTQNDVRFFLEGSNLDILGPEWTQEQVFRVVVLPTINAGRGTTDTVDLSDLDAVIEAYDINEFELR